MHWMSMLWTQLLVACVFGWYAECWYFTWGTVTHYSALTLVWIATLLLHPIICTFIFVWMETCSTFLILSNLTNNMCLVASVFIKLQHIFSIFLNYNHSKLKCMKTSCALGCKREMVCSPTLAINRCASKDLLLWCDVLLSATGKSALFRALLDWHARNY